MARALGSYPICRRFKSYYRYQIWPGGQAAKTPPFHGGNTSSILVRVTKNRTPASKEAGVLFYLFDDENRTGQLRSNKNSPVDCFDARVRATNGSEVGDSRPGHQKQNTRIERSGCSVLFI